MDGLYFYNSAGTTLILTAGSNLTALYRIREIQQTLIATLMLGTILSTIPIPRDMIPIGVEETKAVTHIITIKWGISFAVLIARIKGVKIIYSPGSFPGMGIMAPGQLRIGNITIKTEMVYGVIVTQMKVMPMNSLPGIRLQTMSPNWHRSIQATVRICLSEILPSCLEVYRLIHTGQQPHMKRGICLLMITYQRAIWG